MDSCVAYGASLSKKFSLCRVARSIESRGEKGETVEERKRERLGRFLPSLTISSPPHFFSCSLFFAPSPLSERWNRLAGARRLICGRKKEGHENYDCLIQGSRAGITVLPYPNLNW